MYVAPKAYKIFTTFTGLIILVMLFVAFTNAGSSLAGVPEARVGTQDNNEENPKLTLQASEVENVKVEISKEPTIYLIRLQDAPLTTYRGDIAGLQATNPTVLGQRKLDVDSPASLAYRDYLLDRQADFTVAAEQSLGRPIEVVYQYYAANNGVALIMTAEEADQVSTLPGVVFVQRDVERELHTDNGPTWIGAPAIWDSSQTTGMGEGIIIGVIDTGINPSNPSFADIGGDDYDHTNPWGAGNYVGVCDPNHASYDPTFPCNDKLIGAWGYPTVNSGNPRDYNGHGSHTASTAAGNFVLTATVEAPTIIITRTISGVAPHANIVAYSACCTLSALTAAIDQVVLDGVDVVNYSIGSTGASNLWNDFDTVGFLNARDAGIFVATSAGNSGPNSNTVGAPADAPWLLSAGASTHGRSFVNILEDMNGGDTTPPADIVGKGLNAGHGPAPIVYAGNYTSTLTPNPQLCGAGSSGSFTSPWPPGTFNGEIVVCDRGVFGRAEKGFNVAAAGAGGMVLINVAGNGEGFGTLNGDSHYLPAVHITNADGLAIKAWLASGSGHMATISGVSFSEDYGDIMAGFSSRGPNRAVSDIIVPSVTAPGVDIIAAYGVNDAITWDVVSGTSMASPHAAGAAALLMANNPDWTPAEVQSVMMTTAWSEVFDNDGSTLANPFTMGSGRIDLTAALNAGLALDETTGNYLAANPATGGDPKTLNLSSMGNAGCLQICAWTRTVRSTLATDQEWTVLTDAPTGMTITVTPNTFTLAAGDSQTLTIEANVSGLPAGSWTFGQVMLEPVSGGDSVSSAHFPLAVIPVSGVLPEQVVIHTRRDAGSQLVEDLEGVEITDLTIDVQGLAPGTRVDEMLSQDPTRNNPYDNLNDGTTFFVTIEVPAGARRLVAEVTQSTAVDIDLFVGAGNTPSLDAELCRSTTPTAIEYCNLADPSPGTYWILVQNWAQSTTPPDAVSLVYAIVAGDNGNMHVEGPTSVPELTPFDLRVFWDEPAMEAGDRWYGGFDIGSDPGNPGNVGSVSVNLIRHADDVTKHVNATEARPGDTLTYTIAVQPKVTPEDLAYIITDTIPAGLTYVAGSASATAGTVSVVGNQLTWNGNMQLPVRRYAMSASNEDPNCAVPSANSGAYLNLEAFDIFTNPAIAGNTFWFSAFSSGAPINYWGTNHTGLNFTADGFAFFSSSPGATPSINRSIPNPSAPNNLLAMFWRDFEVVYEGGAANRGVSLATLGGNGPDGGIIIEYDKIEPAPAGSTNDRMDFQVFVWRSFDDTPGRPEVIFAYDNINFAPITGTIGIENATGTDGVQFAHNDGALLTITNGMAICFDWFQPLGEPIEITYRVTVDEGTEGQTLTNDVVHNTDNPGSREATTSASVIVPAIGVSLSGDMALSGAPGTTVTYTLQLTNTGNITDSFELTTSGSIWTTTVVPTTTLPLPPGQSTTVTVTVDIPGDAADGISVTTTLIATSVYDPGVAATADLATTAEEVIHILYFPLGFKSP